MMVNNIPKHIIDWSKLDLNPEVMSGVHYYYQPPPNITIEYPAVVYKRSGIKRAYGSNIVHTSRNKYDVTVIEQTRLSGVVDELMSLPYTTFENELVVDGLCNTNLSLYI